MILNFETAKKIVDYFLPILIIKRIVFLKLIVPKMDFSFYWITTKCANIHLWNSTLIIFYIHINHPFVSNFICTRSTYFHKLFNFEFLLFFWKFFWLKLSLIFGYNPGLYNLYETESIFIFGMIFQRPPASRDDC